MEEEVKFADLGLSPWLMKGLEALGFEKPTPIQAEAIPRLMQGIDVIGQAQTGTGKTFAFGIPLLEKITDENYTQGLIMCPTRELAMQVADELGKLTHQRKGLKILPVYGGASIDKQIQGLRRGAQLVVGTPGRILDHLDRGTLKLDQVHTIILDEADEMLDMGFRDDIEAIMQEMQGEDRQTVFFSATMAKPILDLAKRYMPQHEVIKVVRTELTAINIKQRYLAVKEKDKVQVLQRLVDLYEPKLCLVFANTKKKVDEIVEDMQRNGFFAEALHGDMRQAMRTQVMNKFRQGTIQILVATDVAARGIDVDDVEMVVNYDLPMDSEYYVHRIGRTGRAGRLGAAFSLVISRDRSKITAIERFAKTTIIREDIPSLTSIEDVKKNNFFNKIEVTIANGDLTKYIDWVEEYEAKEEGNDPRILAAALIKMEIHKLIVAASGGQLESERTQHDHWESGSGYSNNDSNYGGKTGRGRDSKQERFSNSFKDSTRLFLSLGKKDRIMPKDIVGAIVNECNLPGSALGSIDLYDAYCFIDVDTRYTDDIINGMKKAQIKGKTFNLAVAENKPGGGGSRGGERNESSGGRSEGSGGRSEGRGFGGGGAKRERRPIKK
ncbi:MAG: DEAD/DEAH box helicase [Bacteroidota bacterium]|nr:DEAD/DEAH box helicase [Bacteroidota bacterium]